MTTSVVLSNRNYNSYFDAKRFENSIYNKTISRERRIVKRKKQKVIDNFIMLLVVITTIVAIAISTLVLYENIRVVSLDTKIAKLEKTLNEKKISMEQRNKELKDDVRYDNLKMKAYLELNMITPTDKNIIYFDKSDQGFVRQYENIN